MVDHAAAPISPTRFRSALQDLPLSSLHHKVAELENSISHLQASNQQMLPFAEAGDADCREAMFENLGVIGRMRERIRLVREEVVGRGMPLPAEEGINGTVTEGHTNGTAEMQSASEVVGAGDGPGVTGIQQRAPSGRLTDEELRRQLEAQMGDDDDDDEEGVHL